LRNWPARPAHRLPPRPAAAAAVAAVTVNQRRILMHAKLRIAALAALLMSGAAQAADALSIDVHRDANCGCCKDWIRHLEANGFSVRDHVEPDMSAVKQRLGVAPRLASCHTGVIDGKFVEGHVPAAQILE